MKYAVIKVTDGNFNIHAEGFTDPNAAKISYHGLCQILWNDQNTQKACVGIVDENLDFLPGYKEFISKVQPGLEA